MKHIRFRLACILLAAVLLGTALVQPAYADHENTYVNTGNQRADIVGVALTQVGYREQGGRTKYGIWYGQPYMDWCGAFISWCANEAGVPQSVIRRNGFASPSDFGFDSSRVFTADQRTPQKGDLFFRYDSSGYYAHAGIVYYTEGNYFYTVEGNTWDSSGIHAVYIRKRDLYGSFRFVSPSYNGSSSSGGGHTHSFGSWENNGANHAAKCTGCGQVRTDDHRWSSGTVLKEPTCGQAGQKEQSCTVCGAVRKTEIAPTGEHTFGDWVFTDGKTHTQSCENCDEKQEKSHTQDTLRADDQGHWYICPDCGGVAGMAAHSFAGGCGTACTVCAYQSQDGHQYIGDPIVDGNYHYYKCVTCGHTSQKESHSYSADCDETCDKCGDTRKTEHTWSKKEQGTAQGHGYVCTVCKKTAKIKEHTPGPAATEESAQTCTVCGWEIAPKLPHYHEYVYTYTENAHSGVCRCGKETGEQPHTWDFSSGTCSICKMPAPVREELEIPWMIILPCVAGAALLTVVIILTVRAVKKKKKKKQLTAV